MLIWLQPSFAQPLKVSPNQRFLTKSDGSPFFYMADTAWELFHRLNRDQADQYLQNRADKGFTVIQAVVLAELDGLHDPNPYGHLPLENDDPTKPLEPYFQHVDYIVNKANSLGLYIGMLPTWGDKIFKDTWGAGPEIFTLENARSYGRWLGKRYQDKKIIWIIGGDRIPRNETDVHLWRSLAEGIVEGAGNGKQDQVMMSFHPQPQEKGSSSTWFHQDPWLDFNMFQNGHCRDTPVWDRIAHDYALTPVKPTMDAEPLYEDHPVCFNAKENGYSNASDIRRSAYLELFAGAHGHTYGCHNIWQMYEPKRQPVNGPLKPWYESLDLPGAIQMTYVRKLMESRPMLERVPDQSILAENFAGFDHLQATRGKDYLFVYSQLGKPFTLNMGKISGKRLKGYWYNPRNGKALTAGNFANQQTQKFTPPTQGTANDWVLVLDDAVKNFPIPGKVLIGKRP
jgi:hypothetical protein